jgi:cell volume regulation protein A
MVVGSDGIGGVEFDDTELTQTLGTIALVLILFEGGLAAGWKEIRPVIGLALSLAIVGTIVTAVIAGLAAAWLLDLSTLEGLLIGAAVAATDSAAIFAVLRGSTLSRRLARSLEGESGMNDPVAVLLVTGFIAWIQEPGYGAPEMGLDLVVKMGVGAAMGIGIGAAARASFTGLNLPTTGLYPVASVATAAVAYGLTEVVHGSGFLAVYIAALTLGNGSVPAKRTVIAFHEGLSWVSQIALFFILGLLVFPSELADVAPEGLALSAVLILVARPVASLVASVFSKLDVRERLMLSWAGLRGAVPIWLATFPVLAGVDTGAYLFNIIFFIVLTSTLIQGATFQPLAERLGLTTSDPAVPRPLVETALIQRLGAEMVAHRVGHDDAIVGRMIKELGLPREALVNALVRRGTAIPPRGSTQIEAGDELHIMVRYKQRKEVEALAQGHWVEGPIGITAPPQRAVRASPLIFRVRRASPADGSPSEPRSIEGVRVVEILRARADTPGALFTLADGRFGVTGGGLVALGGRELLARWCVRRAYQPDISAQERAWWQEVVGALNAPSPPPAASRGDAR